MRWCRAVQVVFSSFLHSHYCTGWSLKDGCSGGSFDSCQGFVTIAVCCLRAVSLPLRRLVVWWVVASKRGKSTNRSQSEAAQAGNLLLFLPPSGQDRINVNVVESKMMMIQGDQDRNLNKQNQKGG